MIHGKNKRTEEVDGGGWISDLAFPWILLTKSSAHYEDVWQIRMCESQLKLRNYVHFRHLKSLQSVSPLRKQEHSRSLFLWGGGVTKGVRQTVLRLQNLEQKYVCFSFQGRQ